MTPLEEQLEKLARKWEKDADVLEGNAFYDMKGKVNSSRRYHSVNSDQTTGESSSSSTSSSSYVLNISHLHKSHVNGNEILSDINLKVEEGRIYSLLGSNGN